MMLIDNVFRLDNNVSRNVNRLVDRFTYKRRIRIREQSGYSITDYTVSVLVDTSEPVADGLMRSDGADIRFGDGEKNAVPFYVESGVGTSNTQVYVKVDLLAGAEEEVVMYYGNETAVSASNPFITFLFYDDFEDGTYTDRWKIASSSGEGDSNGVTVTESGGLLTLDNNAGSGASSNGWGGVESIDKVVTDTGFVFEWYYAETTGIGDEDSWTFYVNATSTVYGMRIYNYGSKWRLYFPGGSYDDGDADSNYHTHKIVAYGTTVKYYIDGSLITTQTASADVSDFGDAYFRLAVRQYSSCPRVIAKWDWVRIRKYTDPEPEVVVYEPSYVG